MFVALGTLPLWLLGRLGSRLYAPHYPDIALHAGLALVARPRRVLALAAHPGDLELFAGGTLSLMAQAGSEITVAVLTAGERGGKQMNLAEIRRREQEQAGAILGYGTVIQLELPDGGLTEHPRLAPAVQNAWERSRPAVVLAPDPQAPFPLQNPDRAAVGYAAAHAAVGQGALLAARERVAEESQLLLYGTRRPNMLVDITEALPEKLAAVKSHRSQLRGPDRLADPAIRAASRVARADTAAYYVEGFYRVL